MWPFKKKKKHEAESPEQAAALAKLDDAVDEAAFGVVDNALAVRGVTNALGHRAGDVVMAASIESERLAEKAREADEDAKP